VENFLEKWNTFQKNFSFEKWKIITPFFQHFGHFFETDIFFTHVQKINQQLWYF